MVYDVQSMCQCKESVEVAENALLLACSMLENYLCYFMCLQKEDKSKSYKECSDFCIQQISIIHPSVLGVSVKLVFHLFMGMFFFVFVGNL